MVVVTVSLGLIYYGFKSPINHNVIILKLNAVFKNNMEFISKREKIKNHQKKKKMNIILII